MTSQNISSAVTQFFVGAISIMGFVGGIIGITAILLFSIASAEETADIDQVVASFERELNHEPPAAKIVTRSAIDDDETYRAINTIHWSTSAQESATLANNETAEADSSSSDSDTELVTAESRKADGSAL